jgi:hypothetical protein
MGPSVVVVTDNDSELPRREAKRLADMLWATHDQLVVALLIQNLLAANPTLTPTTEVPLVSVWCLFPQRTR